MNKFFTFLAVLFVLVACENSVDVGYYQKATFKAITFNATLDTENGASLLKERTDALMQKLSETDADIICLQEVWQPQDMKKAHEAINNAKGDFYLLYSTSGDSSGGEPLEPPCSAAEVMPIGMCYSDNCQDQTGTGALLCLAQQCGTEFQNLSPECSSCMLSEGQTGNLDMQAIMEACMKVPEAPKDGATNGLMLISRFPMKNKEIIALPSDTINRGYLAATLQTRGTMEDISVVCTQLSNLTDGDKSTTLQAQQIDMIIEHFNDNQGDIQFLLGDLNTSPETETMTAHNATIWNKLRQATFQNDWNLDPFCTVCQDNMQIQEREEGWKIMPEYASDHLFYRSFQHSLYLVSNRTYDDELSNRTYTKSTALSSHYGVETLFSSYPIEK